MLVEQYSLDLNVIFSDEWCNCHTGKWPWQLHGIILFAFHWLKVKGTQTILCYVIKVQYHSVLQVMLWIWIQMKSLKRFDRNDLFHVFYDELLCQKREKVAVTAVFNSMKVKGADYIQCHKNPIPSCVASRNVNKDSDEKFAEWKLTKDLFLLIQ